MNKEIRALTGLRGIAATIVMFYHFFEFDPHFQGIATSLVKRGYLSVDIFFILSGFVMALSYAKYFRDRFSFTTYKTFIIKRLARIYPLYIVISIIFTLKLLYNFSGNGTDDYDVTDFIASIFMIQSWGFGFANAAGTTWSLSTEFLAYLLFPILVFGTLFTRPLFAVGSFLLSVLTLLYIVAAHQGISGPLDVVAMDTVLPVLRCLSGFTLGLISYRVSQTVLCQQVLSSSVACIVVTAALMISAAVNAHDLVLFALFPFLVIALYYNSAAANQLYANRAAYHLGVISYSIYLVHPLFVSVKMRLEPIIANQIGDSAYTLIIIAISLLTWGVSYLLYRLVETKGRSWVKKMFLPN